MEDKEEIIVSPVFILSLEKILNYLIQNESYVAQFGDTQIRYEGMTEDTLFGKRSAFTIIRKEK